MYTIGIDLGTSAVKLLLMGDGGEIVRIASREYPIEFPRPGWSQQDPADWWEAVCAGIPELLEGLDASQVRGIGAGGQMHGLVALDENTILRRYPTLDLTKVESYEVYVSGSMGTAEELGLFKAKSSGDLKDIRAAVDRRIEDLKLNFEDYRPDEMPKIEDAVIVEKGSYLLFAIVLVQMALPGQIFIIPQYQMVARMGLANTIFALVFPGLVSAFGVFFLRQAYMSIPDEVGEAAYLDGCNQWQTFYKIMFPLTGTSVAALTIFTAVFAFGDLMWPLVVNSDLKMMTLSSGLSTLRGQFTTNFPVLMAGSLLAMLPMVVLYLIFQRQFVEGIAGTGGK